MMAHRIRWWSAVRLIYNRSRIVCKCTSTSFPCHKSKQYLHHYFIDLRAHRGIKFDPFLTYVKVLQCFRFSACVRIVPLFAAFSTISVSTSLKQRSEMLHLLSLYYRKAGNGYIQYKTQDCWLAHVFLWALHILGTCGLSLWSVDS